MTVSETSAESSNMPEQVRVRHDKLDRMHAAGINPYQTRTYRNTTVAEVRRHHGHLGPDEHTGTRVGLAGRIMLSRNSGKLCFATLSEQSGEIQLMLSLDRLGEQSLADWKSDVDLGDQIGVEGEIITSRRGELSLLVDQWSLLAKCLHPLPEKHHGLTDPEARLRQRYLDLLVNPDSREMAVRRPAAVRALRDTLHQQGFTEVETPMLQQVHGGATARPFITHINAYDLRLYLRIAPELYLKRLVVGGMERVFEINRNFRNEGADSTHNPEFTMLEFYQAHGDYNTVAALTRELIQHVATSVYGSPVVRRGDTEIDISGDWPWTRLHEAVSHAVGEEIDPHTDADTLSKIASRLDISHNPDWGPGKLTETLFEELVEPTLAQPTFVYDFPTETSPLARQHADEPLLTEKWDLIGFGMEMGTGFSELTDPREQRRRLTEQSLLAAGGDTEAMQLDEDFLQALEYGMPPTGGAGIGIDRLLMALTGLGIRETLLFPLVKPN
ncbi:bifunctional lysylphosphatidylglycerol synthetase/lysine--tRNA ligase LysX [Actinopolyspora mortivallis]|uniref:bifunctional lysylphosphatidylglycerol synthetase/lysine--tRNA ligase LysX n=1 Tax=Actinopolyspora mortivallis TaxID=33906 RepID=UPI00036A90FA|nr:bifunctional lysylphosphatidylglycerol synthetase/lysine--tRNA ligase LysX [Actinopolyspora mortivallis]